MLLRRVLADAEQGGACLFKLRRQRREVLVFRRTTRRIVLRVEEQHQLAAVEVRGPDGATFGFFERNVGNCVADVGTRCHAGSSKVSPKVSAHAAATPCRASLTIRKRVGKSSAPQA